MTEPQQPRQQFLHWCHSCGNVCLPYGDACEGCGKIDQLPVSRFPVVIHPWHRMAAVTIMRIGMAFVLVEYDITDDNLVALKSVSATGKQSLKLREFYRKIIINQIAKAEGIL